MRFCGVGMRVFCFCFDTFVGRWVKSVRAIDGFAVTLFRGYGTSLVGFGLVYFQASRVALWTVYWCFSLRP